MLARSCSWSQQWTEKGFPTACVTRPDSMFMDLRARALPSINGDKFWDGHADMYTHMITRVRSCPNSPAHICKMPAAIGPCVWTYAQVCGQRPIWLRSCPQRCAQAHKRFGAQIWTNPHVCMSVATGKELLPCVEAARMGADQYNSEKLRILGKCSKCEIIPIKWNMVLV